MPIGSQSFSGEMLPVGAMIRGIDNTQSRQNILDPMIFPIAISSSLRNVATIHAVSSGRLVPKASTVSPMVNSSIANHLAISRADVTIQSEPTKRPPRHNEKRMIVLIKLVSSLVGFEVKRLRCCLICR